MCVKDALLPSDRLAHAGFSLTPPSEKKKHHIRNKIQLFANHFSPIFKANYYRDNMSCCFLGLCVYGLFTAELHQHHFYRNQPDFSCSTLLAFFSLFFQNVSSLTSFESNFVETICQHGSKHLSVMFVCFPGTANIPGSVSPDYVWLSRSATINSLNHVDVLKVTLFKFCFWPRNERNKRLAWWTRKHCKLK